jgi:non-ribosomal peptide synthase protein (TIGR01720 family)
MTRPSISSPADRIVIARRTVLEQRLRGLDQHRPVIPPRAPGRPIPLSPAQHGLWVVDRMLPDNALYGVYDAVRLRGPLDVAALRGAFDDLVTRHEVLRTVFVAHEDGQPRQQIQPRAGADFHLRAVAGAYESDRGIRASQLVEAELERGFDLEAGPLLRITLFRLAERDHVLLVHLHHIIADEWSCGLLATDVSELYRSRAEGRPATPEGPPVQYADCSVWLRGELTAERVESHLAYWRTALAGVPARLELPADRPRPEERSYRGAALHRILPPELSAELRRFAHRSGTTPFTTLLALLAVVLGRHSDQSRFALGILAAGRGTPGTESALGLFATSAAIPFDLRGAPAFHELLAHTRDHVLGALTHDTIAFEQVVADLKVERDPSRNPLFQVMFKYLESGLGRWTLRDVHAEPISIGTRSAKLDLMVSATDTADGIDVDFNYATDLFEATTVAGIADAFVACTGEVLERPADSIGEISSGQVNAAAGRATGSGPARPASSQRTEREDVLAEIWSQALPDAGELDVHDNFFDIGGDSLLAIKIANLAQRRGLAVSAHAMIKYQTIADIAWALDDGASAAPETAPTSVDGRLTPDDFPLARLDQDALDRVAAVVDPRDIEDIYPLSPLQEGMLFTGLADPHDESYTQWHIYDLAGEVDVPALGRAWQHAVDRHSALRSRFLWSNLPHPVQVISRELPVVIEVGDESGELADTPLDLTVTPHRLHLLRTGPSSHRFVWQTHHLVLDGWSRGEVMSEVLAVYRALRAGYPLPELPATLPLREFVAWRERMRGRDDAAFWRQLLQDFARTTPLPPDRPDPGVAGSALALRVDDDLPARLRDLARRRRVTVGAILHTAWAVTLYRNGGGSDVVFGTIVNGRVGDLPGLESVLGMVMNTLPLRLRIQPSSTLGDVLTVAGDRLAELQDHAGSSLVDIKRQTGLAPDAQLFDSIFQFESGPSPDEWAPAGLRAVNIPTPIEVGYPLAVGAFLDGRLTLQAQYRRDRYTQQTAERLLGDLTDQLRGMVADPDRPIGGPAVEVVPPARERGRAQDEADAQPRCAEAEQTLAGIWSEVFGIAEVGADDNFFELGGDSLLSVRIVALARPAGLTFTSRDVLEKQTIARLAAAAAGAARPPSPAVGQRQNHAALAGRPFPLSGLDAAATDALLTGFAGLTVTDVYPLSPMQSGMLYHRLTTSGEDEYFRQFAWDIRGSLDPSALVSAWQQVVARHAALRTCFRWDGLRRPVQVVLDHHPLTVEQWDYRSMPADARAERVARILADDRKRGIDITTPPVRLALLRTADDTHRLIWSTHHLILDGWSRQIVLDELLELYAAATGNRPASLPEPVPFRDYIAWLDRAPADPGHWRTMLAGYPATLPAPSGSAASNVWGRLRHRTSAELEGALAAAARRHQVSMHALLFTAWSVAMSRAGDVDDIVVGATFAGRSAGVPGVEWMVGMLLDAVPVRVTTTSGSGWDGWLRSVNETFARSQGRAPQSLSEIQRLAGIPVGRPLFDTLFTFEPFAAEAPGESAVLDLRPVDEAPGKPAYPIAVHVRRNSGIEIELEYLATRLDDPAAARLVDEYVRALTELTDDEPPAAGGGDVRVDGLPGSGEIVQTLADIWQDLLEVDHVGPDDDYFALGGDSILAFHVVAEGRRAGLAITVQHLHDFPRLADLATALGTTPAAASPVEPSVEVGADDIPLTPIQHRFFRRTGNTQHYNQSRQLDLTAGLDPELLERALRMAVQRHDALRLRITGAARRQHVVREDERSPLRFVDLSASSAADWPGQTRRIADELHTSLDLANGPLLRAALLRAPQGLPDRLVITIHHVAVDAVSWGFLLDDVHTAYQCLADGREVSLPALTTPFSEWAHRIREYAASDSLAAELPYWNASWLDPPALPVDGDGPNTEESLRTVETVLSAGETTALFQGAHRIYRASPHVLLLTALSRALAGWTRGTSALIDIEGHGREPLFGELDLSRSMGWFTSIHPLAVRLPESGDLTACVIATAEAVRATPHRGLGYGIARYLCPGALSPAAEQVRPTVAFNYFGRTSNQPAEGWYRFADDPSTARDPAAERTHVVEVGAVVEAGSLRMTWHYSANLHETTTMHGVAERFQEDLRRMAAECADPDAPAVRAWTKRLFPDSPALRTALAQHRVPGAGMALIEHGRLAGAWGEGSTHAGAGRPVEAGTPFRACSISKHVTALGVLALVRRGVLDLDADARDYLAVVPAGGPLAEGRLSLRQLLSHTSGLAYSSGRSYCGAPTAHEFDGPPAGCGHQPVVQRRAGGAFDYSSANYALIQRILTDVTGRSFETLMDDLVLEPLGMHDSSFRQSFPHEREPDVATGHTGDGLLTEQGWRDLDRPAAGGLWTTAGDLARVAIDVYRGVQGADGALLDRELARQMVHPVAGAPFGLGSIAKRQGGVLWFGHPGETDAYQCFTAMGLDSGDGLVVMANIGATAAFLPDLLADIDFPLPPAL